MKHCPILTAGDVSPKALVDLVDMHNEYFIAKDINDKDKVKKILGGFKDVHIRDWITSDRERLLILDYSAFMAELHTNYFPADWEDNVCTEILSMKMDKNAKFWDWCQAMCALNIVLRGTPLTYWTLLSVTTLKPISKRVSAYTVFTRNSEKSQR